MRILRMDQRSPEWFEARKGIPTASSASKILTSTGKPSTSRKAYLNDLIADRLGIGKPPFEPTEAMQHGIDTEEEARDAYAFINGVEVEEVGMCVNDEIGASASPDGLVMVDASPDYGLEIKCVQGNTFIAELLGGKVPAKHLPQIHASMAITELDRWDYCCYVQTMQPIIFTVIANEYTHQMREALKKFSTDLDETYKALTDILEQSS